MARFAACLGLLLGCAQLQAYPPGTCGNRVLDPGEGCDDGPGGSSFCAGPEEGERACLSFCSEAIACPAGRTCTDGVCRYVGWEPAGEMGIAFSRGDLTDLDGDGLSDLAGFHAGQGIEVHYGSEATGFGRQEAIPAPGALRSATTHRADGRPSSIVLTLPDAVLVVQGESDGTVAPVVQADDFDPGSLQRALPLGRGDGRDDIVYLYRSLQGIAYARVRGVDREVDMFQNVIYDILTRADLDGDGREEFALPSPTGIQIFGHGGVGQPLELRQELPAPLAAVEIAGAHFAELDGDGRLDLVMVDDEKGWIAPGRAGGLLGPLQEDPRFTAAPDVPGTGDCPADRIPAWVNDTGDVDGDGIDELLTQCGLYGFRDGQVRVVYPGSWFSATLGDFDGNGTLDLASSRLSDDAVVDLHMNDGNGSFQRIDLPTFKSPWLLRAADFDGDGLDDLVVAGSTFGVPLERVEVSYGSPQGLQPPVEITNQEAVFAFDAGRLRQGSAGSDLLLTAFFGTGSELSVSVLSDHGRRLLAPLRPRVGRPLVALPAEAGALQAAPDLLVYLEDDLGDRRLARFANSATGYVEQPLGAVSCDTPLVGVFTVASREPSDGFSALMGVSASGGLWSFSGEDEAAACPRIVAPVGYPRTEEALLADLDGDRDDDLIVLSCGAAGCAESGALLSVHWTEGPEDGSISTMELAERPRLVAFEADGDDAKELALFLGRSMYVLNAGAGALSLAATPSFEAAVAPEWLAAGDVSGDGLDDLVLGDAAGTWLHISTDVEQR